MTPAGPMPQVPPAGQVPLDLAALRDKLAAATDAGQLRPLGLGRVIDGDGALDRLADAVAEFPGSRDGVVVLSAATPMSVSGRDLRSAVEAALGGRFRLTWVTLGPAAPSTPHTASIAPKTGPHVGERLHADETTVAAAVAAAGAAGCVVTVGSGTVTDIGKAAARDDTRLVAVQTAASVNGYADPFSVLLRQGVKRTTPTRWPDTLVIDPEVLSGAPPELNRAGVGDLMAMFTASADWYLASAVGSGPPRSPSAAGASGWAAGADPPYHAEVAGITRAHGTRLFALAAGPDADPGRLTDLARILTLSGIAMGVAGSTAPASGMEHAVSHLLEMAAAARGKPGSYHGAQVGVASIVAAAAWAHVRRRIAAGALNAVARLPDPDHARNRITHAFAPIDPSGAMAAECFSDYAAKLRRLSSGTDPLAAVRAAWAGHDAVLDRLLIGPGELASGLVSAGLPVRFGDLPDPVSDADARWAVASCMLMRQRFSVADLAVLIGGWLDSDVDQVLADAEAAARAAAGAGVAAGGAAEAASAAVAAAAGGAVVTATVDAQLRRPPRVFGGYALDLDGTVYLGDHLLPGAALAVQQIRAAGKRVVFLTNNPLRSAASYAERLTGLGVPADEADVLTPLGVLTTYLNGRHAGTAVLTVAEPLVDATLAAAGIEVTSDPAQAGVVVVSFDRTFSYAKLLLAYRAVRHFGAVIVATNPDPFCPSPDGGWPDCAAMLAAVEACTGARAEAVLGKPGEHMAAELLSRLAVPPSDAAIVGDRISTDVAMSQSLGMTSVLVLSGSTDAGELAASPVRPDYVIEGIGQLLPAGQADGPTDRSSA